MKHGAGITIVEFDGSNPYIKPAEENLPPPVDQNTYCYRVNDAGKYLHRIVLGPNWENQSFNPSNLSCYREKEGEEMPRAKAERPTDEVLREFAERNNYTNLCNRGKREFHASYETVKEWLLEAGILSGTPQTQYTPADNDLTHEDEQTLNPNPAQATNQEPGQGEAGSAQTIISPEDWGRKFESLAHHVVNPYGVGKPGEEHRHIDDIVLDEPLPPHIDSEKNPAEIRPEDINMDDYPKPDWVGLYEARELIEGWIIDVCRAGISKEYKLQLIGGLLDLGVGA